MKRLLTVLALAFGLLTVVPGVHAQGTPRLVVMLVVDQMRADYLQTFERHWQAGFRTLLTEGLVFDNARYPYLNTLTCAGHSTLGTGALPHTHGMVANTWWDHGSHRLVGCTNDPDATDISYGRPAPIGNSGKPILVPTLADELRAQKPGARVVSLSLKARSAIGLAGHGGDAVVWFDDESGSFATSRAFASAPVPAVKAFIDAHPYEQENGSSWTLSAPADSYVMRDAGVGERPPATWSGLFPHRLAGRNGADALFFQLWQASPRSDAYLEGLAESLIDSLALGQREATDFLGISFSALDEVGHSFGPESREIEDVLRQLDVDIPASDRPSRREGRASQLHAGTVGRSRRGADCQRAARRPHRQRRRPRANRRDADTVQFGPASRAPTSRLPTSPTCISRPEYSIG